MKKIISYSLFGNNKYYLEGAVTNAEMVEKIFPGWKCRFYIDHNVNPLYIQKSTFRTNKYNKYTRIRFLI